jgi:Cation/multidrug efflux pump
MGEVDYLEFYSVSQSSDLISSLTGVGATTTNKLTVTALVKSSAKIKDKDAANRLREKLKSEDGLYSLKLSVQEDSFNLGELLGADVAVNIYCEDLDDLKEITQLATEAMREVEGVKSVSNGLEELPLEYNLKIDYEKAKLYNINSAAAIMQVSQALAGSGVTSSVKFKGDVESTAVKFYPSDYVVLEWVKTADENGNYVKVYLDGNSAYILNNTSEDIYLYSTSEEPLVARTGEKIKLSKKADDDEIVRTYTYRLADGTTKTLVTDKSPRYYYSAAPKTPVTLTKLWISNDLSKLSGSDMGIDMGTISGGATGAYLWEILDDSCFTTDAEGNILTIDDGSGNLIPAEIKKTEGYFSILRLNGKKYLTITGALQDGYTVDGVTEAIDARLKNVDFASYYASYGFEGQMAIMDEVFTIIFEILIIGIILVYLVMVAQFQSLKSPLIIMFTIPLALSGCAYSLLLCGMDLTAPALIGAVILVGVIVNNGIVFVDYANQLIREGMGVKDALIKTGYDRLRPILMTALTTIFGMVAMALDQTAAGSLIRPMAVASMGGLLYASLLTLFVVPVMFSYLNNSLEDKQIKNNPPKAYPSNFTAEDIAAYEGAVFAKAEKEQADGLVAISID